MISMSKIYSIRQMRMQGLSVSEIAKHMDISRDTVYKYLEKEDLSSSMPIHKARVSVMDSIVASSRVGSMRTNVIGANSATQRTESGFGFEKRKTRRFVSLR